MLVLNRSVTVKSYTNFTSPKFLRKKIQTKQIFNIKIKWTLLQQTTKDKRLSIQLFLLKKLNPECSLIKKQPYIF